MKRLLALLFVLGMLLCILPSGVDASDTGLEGKKLSILGDSISTYTGVSNNASDNATIGSNAVYYSAGRYGVFREDTWWQQAVDALDMQLLVNNAWSGSCVMNPRSGTVGAYIDRCVQLHNNDGEMPDVIAVYLGTNDFTDHKSVLGVAEDICYDTLITESEEGFVYATPETVCEAYAIMLHKMTQRYPEAEIYCFTLLPRVNQSAADTELAQRFNASIVSVADKMGAYAVDLYRYCGIKADGNFSYYIADNFLHPGPGGMDAITGCFTSALLENSRYVSKETYRITYELSDVRVEQGTAYAVAADSEFTCNLTPLMNHAMSVTVTMGGVDISKQCYSNGRITIAAVTGDLVISANASLLNDEPESFRWEMIDNRFDTVSSFNNVENALTMTHGSITDGKLSRGRFTLSQPVVLRHDRQWILQWRSSGSWSDNTDGALLFAGAPASATAGTPYLYRRHNSDFIAFGECSGGRYYNYGVAVGAKGIDATKEHTYQLKNRISVDGSNMVYLYVDGQELGPMNHHWIGGTDQKKTVDWINGKDFVFSYMGTTPHTIGNCYLEYVQVWEDGHNHVYQSGVCTGCGEEAPAPVITRKPEDAMARLGERFHVEVEAEGENLTYQWYLRPAGSSKWYKSSIKDSAYDSVMTAKRDGREIYCLITDANGASVTTDPVRLICLPGEGPRILTQPVSCSVPVGQNYRVAVEAAGDGLTYRWYFRLAKSDKWYPSSLKTDIYTGEMTKSRHNGEVYCVITDVWGNSITTETVKLTVEPDAPLRILRQPADTEAMLGERFCIQVEAEGEGLSYQWYLRSKPDGKWFKSSIRDNTYDTLMTEQRIGREVYCVITDAYGNQITTECAKILLPK